MDMARLNNWEQSFTNHIPKRYLKVLLNRDDPDITIKRDDDPDIQ